MWHLKSKCHFRSSEATNSVLILCYEIYNLIFFVSSLLKFSHLSEGLSVEHVGSGIEAVITGRTRNAFGGNATWVRIPPTPPQSVSDLETIQNPLKSLISRGFRRCKKTPGYAGGSKKALDEK